MIEEISPALLVIVEVVAWMVASEGIWGAVQTFLCTLLAGLLAMNFFEPLAYRLGGIVPDGNYSDIVAALAGSIHCLDVRGMRMGYAENSCRPVTSK